jgi:hypothetical protein
MIRQYAPLQNERIQHTLIAVDAFKRLHEQIGTAASDMNKGAFLAKPQTGSYCQTL